MKTDIYHNFDDIQGMQEEWDAFMESQKAEIFLTFDWCRIWWKYYGTGRQLRIFVFRHESAIVGIIPTFFETIWLGPVFLRVGKVVGMDCTIATFRPPIETEFGTEVIKYFLNDLAKNYSWDIFHFGPISGIFDKFDNLLNTFQKYIGKKHCIRKHHNVDQTYFMINNSWDSGISKKQARLIKQKYKALNKALGDTNAAVVSKFASAHNCQQVFDRFCEMHKKHWHTLGNPGHFGDFPKAKQFHAEIAQAQLKHNRLRLLEVTKGDHYLGYKYAFKFGEYFVEFLDARLDDKEFKHASIGTIVFCEQLKKAFAEDVKCIDSLRIKYEHKQRMGGKLFPIHSIYICSRRIWSIIRIRIFCNLAWILNMAYYNIWYHRIASKLSLKRRSLWKIWLRTNCLARLF